MRHDVGADKQTTQMLDAGNDFEVVSLDIFVPFVGGESDLPTVAVIDGDSQTPSHGPNVARISMTQDESGILQGPDGVKVVVPAKPALREQDYARDFPRQDPPEVHYRGRVSNYWSCLEYGCVGNWKLSPDQASWLLSIESEVSRLLDR